MVDGDISHPKNLSLTFTATVKIRYIQKELGKKDSSETTTDTN